MKDRIKKLRKTLSLTQEEFGTHLGITNTAVSKLEKGENNITEQNIKAICLENWNGRKVNENWLRTGNGNMFNITDVVNETSDHFEHIIKNASAQKKAVLAALVEMMYYFPDDKWDYVFNQFESCLQEARKGKYNSDLFSDIPETAEELEKMYPPIDIPTSDKEAG